MGASIWLNGRVLLGWVASSKARGIVLCPRARHLIILCLVLIQPRKTGKHPDMTEKLLTACLGRNAASLRHFFEVPTAGKDLSIIWS